jgi:hypothetical protein
MRGTAQVVDELRAEGFMVTRTYVSWVLRDRHVPTPPKGPGGALIWADADVVRLRSFLIRRNRGPALPRAESTGTAGPGGRSPGQESSREGGAA